MDSDIDIASLINGDYDIVDLLIDNAAKTASDYWIEPHSYTEKYLSNS